MATATEEKAEYIWPQADKNARRPVRPKIPTTRVVKVGYVSEWSRFTVQPDGTKVVNIGQWRYPMADKKFDRQRLAAELTEHGMVELGDLFSDAPNYCQMLDCWRTAPKNQAFCSKNHQELTLTAHNRILTFE